MNKNARLVQRIGFSAVMCLNVSMALGSVAQAQSVTVSPKPYATLDRQAVTYRGPVGSSDTDFLGGTAVIGLILPLQGTRAAEGRAILAAAQLALEQEQKLVPPPSGRCLALATREESGPWGQASSEILKLVEQDHALVVLTSANGNVAHQAEQLANKISFPILTLASDPTTTETNVPWIFRLGPSDTDQARAFGRRIYNELELRKVLFVMQTDHDGRMGQAEFDKAAGKLQAPKADVFEVAAALNTDTLTAVLQQDAPEAVVVWTDGKAAEGVVSAVRRTRPLIPIFLSTKAAQLRTRTVSASLCTAAMMEEQKLGDLFTVVSLPAHADLERRNFEAAYSARIGSTPGVAAGETYEAVRLIAAGWRETAGNRILLREYLAREGKFRLKTAGVPFAPAGNDSEEFTIVTVAEPSQIQTDKE